jgi:hypothetical protein
MRGHPPKSPLQKGGLYRRGGFVGAQSVPAHPASPVGKADTRRAILLHHSTRTSHNQSPRGRTPWDQRPVDAEKGQTGEEDNIEQKQEHSRANWSRRPPPLVKGGVGGGNNSLAPASCVRTDSLQQLAVRRGHFSSHSRLNARSTWPRENDIRSRTPTLPSHPSYRCSAGFDNLSAGRS